MNKAAIHQPEPMPGKERVLDHVLKDVGARARAGLTKYGTYLETHNGRDPLWDAYQEAIDLVMYLRQALLERDAERECSEEPRKTADAQG